VAATLASEGPRAAAEPDPAEPSSAAPRHRWLPRHYPFGGLAVALAFLWFSMTPTLLPRGPLFQAVISALSAALGYAIGVLASRATRYVVRHEPAQAIKSWAWRLLPFAAVFGTGAMFVWFFVWEHRLRVLMDAAQLSAFDSVIILVLTVALFGLIIGVCRAWVQAARWVARQVNRVAPRRVSAVVGIVVVLALTIGLLNGVVVTRTMSTLNATFKLANRETATGTVAPTTPFRSGGPGSLVTWNSLGHDGRNFVTDGPTVEQLSRFSGRPAMQPVRAYAGLASAEGVRAEADLMVRELEHSGGFQRSVLGVGTTTGTGSLNEKSATALEYLSNGNSALFSVQYSYLPSPLSFLADHTRAEQAGKALFDAVYDKWKTLPPNYRPKLVVFGESLGSFGSESAFSGLSDMQARTAGVVLNGPPSMNTVWSELESTRDAGSPQRLPIYQHGQAVRFIARASDLDALPSEWPAPRVLYLQHPSDPVIWWSPSLLFKEPDWLKEPRGYDVLAGTRWFPIVSFLQLAADMAVSTGVPDGHGQSLRRGLRQCVGGRSAAVRMDRR